MSAFYRFLDRFIASWQAEDWRRDKRKYRLCPDEFPWGYPEWSEQ